MQMGIFTECKVRWGVELPCAFWAVVGFRFDGGGGHSGLFSAVA